VFDDDAPHAAAEIRRATAEMVRRARVARSLDEDSTIVDSSSLGYREGMTTEVRIAPRWGNAVTGYLRYLRALDRSENTVYLRGYQLRVFSQALRHRDPWNVSTEDVERFMASLQLSRSTKRSMLCAIKGFYDYGTKRHFCDVDPCEPIKNIKFTMGVPRPAPDAAIRAALDRAEERVRVMLYLGAFVGLRRSEISRVHTRDLRHTKEGPSLYVLGKGERERIVPIPPLVLSYIESAPEGWLFPSWHRGQIGSDGRAIEEHLSSGHVGVLMHRALPDGVTPHMLRHRYASTLYAATKDIRAVQDALGHTSVATTQVYTAVPKDTIRGALSAISTLG
jgi:site-specific recombinase XerD